MLNLGCFLLPVSIILIVVGMILVLATDVAIPVLEPLFCSEEETLIRTSTANYEGGQNINYYCVDDVTGDRTSMDGQLFLVIGALFAPMILSILFLVIGGTRQSTNMAQTLIQQQASQMGRATGATPDFTSMTPKEMMAWMGTVKNIQPAQELSLKDKLQQLRDAYDEGLIDRAEFDKRKDALLDELSDT